MQVGSEGGAGDARLRGWWRGRLGLSKEEQLALFEHGEQALSSGSADNFYDGEQSSGSASESDLEVVSESSSSSDSSDSDGGRR